MNLKESDKEIWVKNTRTYKNSKVWFNVTGKMADDFPPLANFPIAESHWVRTSENAFIVLFDAKKFQEESPRSLTGKNVDEKFNTKTFVMHEYESIPGGIDGKNCSERGFALFHRIAPRLFNGIVLKFKKQGKNHADRIVTDNVDFLSKASVYINLMTSGGQNDFKKLLPVYDVLGNLHWPKEMSYEEVKKFVAERESKNANNKEE